jgi:NAD(P)-dependent dehydrogenase (short-subunit alcohol dehydrogenase family)
LNRIIAVVLLVVSFVFITNTTSAAHHELRAVLVTGASTGIGRAMAETLAENGFYVYAGARKQADIDELSAIENIEGIRLDVTVQEEIDAAVATVEKGGRGLWGLINNAGIYLGGPLVEVDLEEMEWIMNVNVYGVYRVTQAFAPMIIESKGRISTTGSISGTLSGRFYGHYSMTKHAIEAYTDSLSKEMKKFDVQVSVIEPGNYASKIGPTAKSRLIEKGYNAPGSLYEEEMTEFLEGSWDGSGDKDPAEVAEAALHAMSSDEPLLRYMVVPAENEAGWTIDKQIEELVQLNQWQGYSYTREQLIEKLDAALAKK